MNPDRIGPAPRRAAALASLLLLLVAPLACGRKPAPPADTLRVVGVHDGDTLTVLRGSQQVRVRLHGVDAPETRQDFGSRAKQFASSRVFGKQVRLKERDRDRYGRVVAEVFVDGRSLNEELVKSGMAWAYREYSKDYVPLEEQARRSRVGLWSRPRPVPPWEWRRDQRDRANGSRTGRQSASGDRGTAGSAGRQSEARNGASGSRREGQSAARAGASPNGARQTAVPSGARLVGSSRSKVFHQPDCSSLPASSRRVYFRSRSEALRQGYRPHKACGA